MNRKALEKVWGPTAVTFMNLFFTKAFLGNLPEWVIYDGFNMILAFMTKALIGCGAPEDVKDLVLGLWTEYLGILEVAFYDSAAAADRFSLLDLEGNTANETANDTAVETANETQVAVPDWLSQITDPGPSKEHIDESNLSSPLADQLLFTPNKL